MAGRCCLFLLAIVALGSPGCPAVEDRLVYHPAHTPEPPLPEGQSAVQDVYLRSADGTKLHARWCSYEGARGAVLYCHGNAGDLAGRGRVVRELAEAVGESVLIFDYPGFGKSEGCPTEPGCHAAADAAYDWLVREQHLRPEDILIYGESLGGGVAVHLAARQPHRALILVRTFTSLPDVAQNLAPWLPVHALMVNRYDNLEEIAKCKQPIFIAQGDRDCLVPFAHGERLYAAAGGRATFFPLRGADHNDPLGWTFYEALRTFLRVKAPRSATDQ
jgi:fermentation-respiration switch protein FrsA (DUF1100 family)